MPYRYVLWHNTFSGKQIDWYECLFLVNPANEIPDILSYFYLMVAKTKNGCNFAKIALIHPAMLKDRY